ncbi:hypothetical protein [Novosphingobium guangzhouense]|uniref:Uncharacterized protein n=1 Tax=Novosphingobium guangzhouense TaxID=1850347 RepID=A0A2K2FUR4_9SPHN|nr:hypothetical protein [Novosphingobium guangzhouense]PNU02522.1 hypothetical protein A8V01_09080 [Novosphingobium guangzhouense]
MILLPEHPAPNGATPRVLDFGGFQEGAAGAETQRINQLGNRYAVSFTLPKLKNDRDGRIWVNRLLKALQEGGRMPYPLLDFYPGTPNRADGSAVEVDGAGQAGKLLAIRNLQPNYAFCEGQPISLEIAGQHYFDFVAETAIADAAGKVTIRLTQMLRKPAPDGAVLHVAKPMIEGFIMGNPVSWELALERNTTVSFEIRESR